MPSTKEMDGGAEGALARWVPRFADAAGAPVATITMLEVTRQAITTTDQPARDRKVRLDRNAVLGRSQRTCTRRRRGAGAARIEDGALPSSNVDVCFALGSASNWTKRRAMACGTDAMRRDARRARGARAGARARRAPSRLARGRHGGRALTKSTKSARPADCHVGGAGAPRTYVHLRTLTVMGAQTLVGLRNEVPSSEGE